MHNTDDELSDLLSIDVDEPLFSKEEIAKTERELEELMARLDDLFPDPDSELLELAGITNDMPAIPDNTSCQDTSSTGTTRITIRIDSGVLAACRREGRRRGIPYQTLINQILRTELMKQPMEE
ncbi:BrnA antitoxin family protein [Laribacter hongkongensis]|uniref:BrnA antitoxin family protein n=1 Tax=Laribacter hongkongensis TaxID=168471 RepID=UPI001EFC4802|nr:BrnA antitoxin family protein [Laribacter hongkongensis]MCG9056633.1 BrnA antitoxin family protein [Laribacter hongkongensis]